MNEDSSEGDRNNDPPNTNNDRKETDTSSHDGEIVEAKTSRKISCSSCSVNSSGYDEEASSLQEELAHKRVIKQSKRYNYKCCFQTCNNNNRMEGIKFHRLPPPQIKELPSDASLMRQLTKIKKEIHRELILKRCGKLNEENRLKKDLRICNRHKFKSERIVRTICIPSSGVKKEIEIIVHLPADSHQEVQRKLNTTSSISHLNPKNSRQLPSENIEKSSLGLWSFSAVDIESKKPENATQDQTECAFIIPLQLEPINKDSNSQKNKICSTSTSAHVTKSLFQDPSSAAQEAKSGQHDTTNTGKTLLGAMNNIGTISESVPTATLTTAATATMGGAKQNREESSGEIGPNAKKKKSKYHWNYKCCFGDCSNTNIDNVKFHRIPPKQNKELPPGASFERHETMNKKNLQRRLLLQRCGHFERDKNKNDLRICDAHEFKKETITVVTNVNGKSHESKFDLLLPKQEGVKTRLFSIKATSQTLTSCRKEGNFLGMTKKKPKKNKKILK